MILVDCRIAFANSNFHWKSFWIIKASHVVKWLHCKANCSNWLHTGWNTFTSQMTCFVSFRWWKSKHKSDLSFCPYDLLKIQGLGELVPKRKRIKCQLYKYDYSLDHLKATFTFCILSAKVTCKSCLGHVANQVRDVRYSLGNKIPPCPCIYG